MLALECRVGAICFDDRETCVEAATDLPNIMKAVQMPAACNRCSDPRQIRGNQRPGWVKESCVTCPTVWAHFEPGDEVFCLKSLTATRIQNKGCLCARHFGWSA